MCHGTTSLVGPTRSNRKTTCEFVLPFANRFGERVTAERGERC